MVTNYPIINLNLKNYVPGESWRFATYVRPTPIEADGEPEEIWHSDSAASSEEASTLLYVRDVVYEAYRNPDGLMDVKVLIYPPPGNEWFFKTEIVRTISSLDTIVDATITLPAPVIVNAPNLENPYSLKITEGTTLLVYQNLTMQPGAHYIETITNGLPMGFEQKELMFWFEPGPESIWPGFAYAAHYNPNDGIVFNFLFGEHIPEIVVKNATGDTCTLKVGAVTKDIPPQGLTFSVDGRVEMWPWAAIYPVTLLSAPPMSSASPSQLYYDPRATQPYEITIAKSRTKPVKPRELIF